MWEYKGFQFEGDVADADFVDHFEQVMRKVKDTDDEIVKNSTQMSAGDVIRGQCKIVDEAFDELFGAGTSEKIFAGKVNMIEHLEALNALVEWGMARKKEINDAANRYAQRYQNRAQRRHKKR